MLNKNTNTDREIEMVYDNHLNLTQEEIEQLVKNKNLTIQLGLGYKYDLWETEIKGFIVRCETVYPDFDFNYAGLELKVVKSIKFLSNSVGC